VNNATVDQAFADGAILRTHLLRSTWYFVLPADIRWMLDLTAPRVNALNAHYYGKLELDDQLFAKSNGLLRKALKGGKQLTRKELAALLDNAGINARRRWEGQDQRWRRKGPTQRQQRSGPALRRSGQR
jgi:hypothetical protein